MPTDRAPELPDGGAERRPRSVYGVGSEPDPRFSMANERTALAWVRTALATVAAGIGLTTVVRLASLPRGLELVAAAMCLIGALLSVSAVLGWRRREVALRTGRPLPSPVALQWLAAGIVLVSTALAVVVAVGRR
jgi:putative membrane protein